MNQPIIVAVGVDGAPAAVSFAVDAARRAHTSVHLVHVVQVTSTDAYAGIYAMPLEAGQNGPRRGRGPRPRPRRTLTFM